MLFMFLLRLVRCIFALWAYKVVMILMFHTDHLCVLYRFADKGSCDLGIMHYMALRHLTVHYMNSEDHKFQDDGDNF